MLSAIIILLRPPVLILIAALLSCRLSRYTIIAPADGTMEGTAPRLSPRHFQARPLELAVSLLCSVIREGRDLAQTGSMMVCSGWVRFAKRQFQRAFDGFVSSWANTFAVAAAELSTYHPLQQAGVALPTHES
jgi:hypothetical protein